jgi:hypothetical protein
MAYQRPHAAPKFRLYSKHFGPRTRIPRNASISGGSLAKPNYKFQKRQKDLAKQKKKEEKRLKKAARTGEQPGEGATPE